MRSKLSISRKIIRNTLFNSIGRFWTTGVAILLTPYIVSRLGVQRFGIWSLVLAITGYFGLFDFGMGASFVKYVSEYYAKEDDRALNGIIATGFLFYLILALIISGSVYWLADPILGIFKVPAQAYEEARFVLLMATVIFALSNLFGVFQAVLIGLQHMDVTNAITIMASVPNVVGTVLFLELGYGMRGLVINRAIVFALIGVLLAVYSFRLLPRLRLSPEFLSLASLRELLGYGMKVQITNMGALVNLQTNKILVGYFLSLGFVTFYELGFKVAYAVISLPMLLISAITPAASELEARQDKPLLRQLYARGSKYLALVATPLTFFTVSSAHSIMLAWMGRGYQSSALVIQLLTVGLFINLLTGVGTTVARGIGRPEYETRYTLLMMALTIILGVAFVIRMGFTGVLVAALTASAAGSSYFMLAFHRYLKKPLLPFMREIYLKPVGACLVAGLSTYALGLAVGRLSLPTDRLLELVTLMANGLAFSAIYLAVILRSGYLDAYDRQVLLRSRLFYPANSREYHQP